LQINLTYTCSKAELEAAFSHAVGAIATFPGLLGKIWILNDTTKEAGGLYRFETAEALNAYLNSPIIAALRVSPLITSIQVKSFAVIDTLTAQTRGFHLLPTTTV